MFRSSRRRGLLGRACHLPAHYQLALNCDGDTHERSIVRRLSSLNYRPAKGELPHTSGTASLSACALAASVVTVRFTRADLEKAELLNGAARLVLNARKNIVVIEKKQLNGGGERN